MSILWREDTREFHLRNNYYSYIIVLLPNGEPSLAYFGSELSGEESYSRLARYEERALSTHTPDLPADFCLDWARREYPVYGRGDFRFPALEVQDQRGFPLLLDLRYQGHLIRPGKPPIEGLPSIYTEGPQEAETVTIFLRDEKWGVEVELHYTVFSDYPILTRHGTIRNSGSAPLRLNRVLSAVVDLDDDAWDLVQFSGAWARERRLVRRPLVQGSQSISSNRGVSSAQQNPAIILARRETTEQFGEAYGLALVYSGNFSIEAEVGSHGDTRLGAGVNPFGFTWNLEGGGIFETPEVVLGYTDRGLTALSQSFHQLFGKRLARGPWRDKLRPILLNNWEATYFDFTEEKLLRIAADAKDLGVELFVLDDGWFGERNDDTSSLGDWEVNLKKLPHGIEGLARKIEALGLKFGLWIEPEMVSSRSQLYRSHPDWAVGSLADRRTLGRNQLVLDLSRPEVVDYLGGAIGKLLRSAPISYIKWDMNRQLTEPLSLGLPLDRQGEFFHRYVLGLYELYRRLTEEFSGVLFESCSAGGNRFDPGILAYAPQGWVSDDTDAVERLRIQWGTSFFYPPSSMGAHVSAVPNHQVGRRTPIGTRSAVAFFGAFGYELDPGALTDLERDEIREQIRFYKGWREVFQFGIHYRLRGPYDGDGNEVWWMSVSRDKRRAVVQRTQILARPNPSFGRLSLRGLDGTLRYRVSVRPSSPVKDEASVRLNMGPRRGDELMRAGLLLGGDGWNGVNRGDFASWLFTLEAE